MSVRTPNRTRSYNRFETVSYIHTYVRSFESDPVKRNETPNDPLRTFMDMKRPDTIFSSYFSTSEASEVGFGYGFAAADYESGPDSVIEVMGGGGDR